MIRRIERLLPLRFRGLTLARIGRGLLRPPRRLVVRWRHRSRGGVRVLANSIPKAGTHLLSRCLDLSGHFESLNLGLAVFGHRGKKGLAAWKPTLARLGGGLYVQAHLPHESEAAEILSEIRYKHVLITRDPRDIVVSRYLFETRHEYLPYHEFFAGLPDDEARLLASIGGDEEAGLRDIGTRMRAYMRWRNEECCIVRYEKLVGPKGGGTRSEQTAELDRLFRHLDLVLTRARLEAIADKLYDTTARTFRKGQVGGWREHFSPSHKELFKELAGDVLIEMGYESSSDW